jgi:hypothetical protein
MRHLLELLCAQGEGAEQLLAALVEEVQASGRALPLAAAQPVAPHLSRRRSVLQHALAARRVRGARAAAERAQPRGS